MPSLVAKPRTRQPRTDRAPSSPCLQPSAITPYLQSSQRPLTILLFILPLLLLHELGIRHFAQSADALGQYRIAASTLLLRFFQQWGAHHHHLPALAIIAILLAWHLAKKDPWTLNPAHLPAMAFESAILAAPLVAVFLLSPATTTTYVPPGDWKLLVSIYLGAGVYEEALFRLTAFAILSLLLIDLARIPQTLAVPVIVLTAASTFAAYHTLGAAQIPWQAFVFITLRGTYYGVLFLSRGFGITVGTHVAYDLLFLSLARGAYN